MTRCCSKLKTLLCLKTLFALVNAVVIREDILKHMSFAERRSFFGTEDGSVPKFELVELKRPSRSKRTAQDPLDITFNAFGTASTASLTIVENNLIGRSLTGIWFAETSEYAYQNITYTPKPDVFDFANEFDLLQNVNEGSAVVRFRSSNGQEDIMGIIKQNYTVKSVPRNYEYLFVNVHRTGKKMSDDTNDQEQDPSQLLVVFKNPHISQELFRIRRHDVGPFTKQRQHSSIPSVVYPKLLVTPDYGLISRYDHIGDFIKEFIAQANAVDAMFRQLRDPEVRLNIAGIIIPRDPHTVPYIESITDTYNYRFNAHDALDPPRKYFYNEQRRLPHSTYDVVFILTTIPMYVYDDAGNINDGINGIGRVESGCDGGPAIVKFHAGFGGIHLMAHELGHVFGASHDEEGPAVHCPVNEGYTMVPDLSLAQTLGWSTCSKLGFKSYFRSDKANCTYSPPEEVLKLAQEMPGPWLPIDGQCDNLFNDSTGSCIDDTSETCTFGCRRSGSCLFNYVPAWEGSFRDNETLCIGQKWQTI